MKYINKFPSTIWDLYKKKNSNRIILFLITIKLYQFIYQKAEQIPVKQMNKINLF